MSNTHSTFLARLIAVVTAHCLIGSNLVLAAGQIVVDGRTQTQLQVQGNVTDVTTQTVNGRNAFNSFSRFDVNPGNTVNLHVPDAARNLLNLVHDKGTRIDGTLNALQNGRVGGNVFFANPHGMVVGASGVVNVGALSVTTPTPQFMNGFFDAAGNPSAVATEQLLRGTAPVNPDAVVDIQGQVNAQGDMRLQAGSIVIAGDLNSLPGPTAGNALANPLNTDGLETGADLVERNGEIWLLASSDARVTGSVQADGTDGVDAGAVQLRAGGDIELVGDARLSARGRGVDSDGGEVVVLAQQSTRIADSATLDAGSAQGDGGFAELSAMDTVILSGGSLLADAPNGTPGDVLIDPPNLTIDNDLLRADSAASSDGISWNAGSLTLEAAQKITIDVDVVVSTRQVVVNAGQTARDAHINNLSSGDSGNLTLTAPAIELLDGSMLLSHADSGGGASYAAGDITLNADVSPTDVPGSTTVSSWLGDLLSGVIDADGSSTLSTVVDGLLETPLSQITLAGATVKGRDIELVAQGSDRLGFDKQATARIDISDSVLQGRHIDIKAIADTSLLPAVEDPSGAIDLEDLLDFVNPFDATPFVSFSASQAGVTLDSSELTAAGNINVDAEATSKAKSLTSFYAVAVGYGYSAAEANTRVIGGSQLSALGGELSLTATTNNVVQVQADSAATNKPIAATWAQSDVYGETRVNTGDAVLMKANSINLATTTNLDITTQATATERGASSAAMAVAMNNLETITETLLGGQANVTGKLSITADHDVEQNITNASATSNGSTSSFSTKLNNSVAGLQRQGATAVLGQFTSKGAGIANFLFPGIRSGKLNLGGTLAMANTDNTVRAAIQPGARVTVDGAVDVKAKLADDFNLGAVTLAKSDGVGLGGAVAIGDYNNVVEAFIGDGASLDADGLLTMQAETGLAYPWQIDWSSLEDVLNHLTGGLDNFLFTNFAFNDSKGSKFSLAAAVDVIDLDNSASTWIGEDAAINQQGGAGAVSLVAANDINFVQAAGAKVPFPLINRLLGKRPSSNGLGGAAGFIKIEADALAWIDDGTQLDASSLSLDAQTRERLIQLNKSGAKVDNIGVSGTLAHTVLSGTAAAGIESGAVVDVAGNIDIDARTDANGLLIAGATLSGGNAGVGMSISLLSVDTATDAFIADRDGDTKGAGQLRAAEVSLDAVDDSDIDSFSIASATATGSSGGGSGKDAPKGKGKYGLAVSGDVSLNDIAADVSAYVGDSADLIVDGLGLAALRDSRIRSLSGTVAYASSGKNSAGLAGSYSENELGGETLASINDAQVDVRSAIALKATTQGEIWALAAGGAGVPSAKGITVAGQVTNNASSGVTEASVRNAEINGRIADSGELSVTATDTTDFTSIAGAVALGGKGGVGAGVSINDIANRIEAGVWNAALRASSGIVVNAGMAGTIQSLAAAITASQNFAISGAVSINEIGNTISAQVDNSAAPSRLIDVGGELSLIADNKATIRAIAGGVSASGKAALGASVAINQIHDLTEAGLTDVTQRTATADTTVKASSAATIESIAGTVAVASSSVGAGAGVAVNRVGNITRAFTSGSRTDLHVRNAKVEAISAAHIDTISVALGASGNVGIGGSASANHLDNQTEAYIDAGAVVKAEHNVGVLAESDDRIRMAAGAAGIGVKAAGVGVTLGINNVQGYTRAHISGPATQVTALAKDVGQKLTVKDGGLTAGIDLADQVDIASYSDLDLADPNTRTSVEVTGVAVNAASSQYVGSIAANVAAGQIAAGLAENINVIGGITDAYIRDAAINIDNAGAAANQQVDVRASNIAYGNSFLGNVAVGAGAAGAGADLHSINRSTWAFTSGGRIAALGELAINATALQGLSSVAVGGSVGGSAGAGTLILSLFESDTRAWLDATKVVTGDLTVAAESDNAMYLVGGALAGGGGSAVGGSFVVASSNSNTSAVIRNASGTEAVEATGAVQVGADNDTSINHIVISGALGGGAGIAGMASINLVTDTTEAGIYDSQIGSNATRAASVRVAALHSVAVDSIAGSLGVGFGSAGVGAGASVNIVKARTLAGIDQSQIFTTGLTEVTATSNKQVDALAMTAGGGLYGGIGGAAAVTLIGSDVKDEGADEVDSGTLAAADDFTKGDRGSELSGGDDVLTASERAEINNSTRADPTGVARGTDATAYTHRTAATIAGADSRIHAAGITVQATDKLHAKSTVGGFGISAGLGAGAGVGVTQVAANVEAGVANGVDLVSTGAVLVKAEAQDVSHSDRAIELLALNGGVGAVGIGAAVAVGEISNTVNASLGGDVQANDRQVSVTARDATSLDIDAYGAAAGALGAGAVVARGRKNSTVIARTLAGSDVTARGLNINALVSGRLHSRTLGAAGGLLAAGNGSDARVEQASVVQAHGGNDSVLNLSGDLDLSATATPQLDADAKGFSVAGNLSVGISIAKAKVDDQVLARLGENTEVRNAKQVTIRSSQTQAGNSPTARANAVAAGGALTGSVSATTATAENNSRSEASIGSGSALTVQDGVSLAAQTKSYQRSDVTGISVALGAALGSNVARSSYETEQSAGIGDGVSIKAASLTINASGTDTNYADTIAGAGALVASSGNRSETFGESTTDAFIGDGNESRSIDVAALTVSASHNSVFNTKLDALSVGLLLGLSRANTFNEVSSSSMVSIGSSRISADTIDLDAETNTAKDWQPGAEFWNIAAGGGGFADVARATSETVVRSDALIDLSGASIEQTGTGGAPGMFAMDAFNAVVARDKVNMDSLGGVSVPDATSTVSASTTSRVHIGNGAILTSLGDLNVGARNDTALSAQVAVDAYGLAGAPAGDTNADANSRNLIEVGDAALTAKRDINLNAGANSDPDSPVSSVSTRARTNLWNNTAIPINQDPIADAVSSNHSQIDVGAEADLQSVRHTKLFAEQGEVSASGVGIAKDLWREALAAVASAISNAFGGGDVSFETRRDSSVTEQSTGVNVDGQVRVGINRKQLLAIDIDGTVEESVGDITITDTDFKDVAADILERIEALRGLILEYSVADADADASIAVAAYESEIRFLERKLKELGYGGDDNRGGFIDIPLISELEAAEQAVDGMTITRSDYQVDKEALVVDNDGRVADNATLRDNNAALRTQVTNHTVLRATKIQERSKLDPVADKTQYDQLTQQINGLTGQIDAKNDTIAANVETIDLNEQAIGSNEIEIGRLDGLIVGLDGQIAQVQQDISDGVFNTKKSGGPVATVLTVSDATAQLGNIYVRGGALTGEGNLDAPGDAEIKITNNGPNFLILGNLTIPADDGGKLFFNNVDVLDNNQINGINGPSGGAAFSIRTADSKIVGGVAQAPDAPRVEITSKYDPLDPFYSSQTPESVPPLAPDLILRGDISNLRGLVKVQSEAGSIRLEQKVDSAGQLIPGETATIRAGTVEIETRNGDFVQSYADAFFHAAGAPLVTVPGDENLNPPTVARIDRSPEEAGAGIVANGSVLIAARYLNINGIIQSGVSEWGVRIPAEAEVTIPGVGVGSFEQARTDYTAYLDGLAATGQSPELGSEYYDVSGATVAGLAGNIDGDWERIKVRYNAKEDRLELGGVQVQGGYIELFGEVFNTNRNGGGRLRVLDGFGQIKVDNQSNRKLMVNLLDAGRGVQGEINITNIVGQNADGSAIIETTQYIRGADGSRNAEFTPDSGKRYAQTVGSDQVTSKFYRYSQNGWFGITDAPVNDRYLVSSEPPTDDALAQGEFLGVLKRSPANDHYFDRTQTKQTSQEKIEGRSWKDCNWWTLCANATYYREYTVVTGTKTIKTRSVRADYPISIDYIGFDSSKVDINSLGSVLVNGAVNSRAGLARINTAGGIEQQGDLPILTGVDVNLLAATGIGSSDRSVQLDLKGGQLNAASLAGEIHLSEVVGDLAVAQVGGANVDKVRLEADGNILAAGPASYVQGRRVGLTSRSGGIGETATPLVVRTGYSADQALWPDYGLEAVARQDITISNQADAVSSAEYSGNLLLIAAESQAGDVYVETTGGILDNNPFARTDDDTVEALAALWDDLRLRGEGAIEKADEAVAAFENGVTQDYRSYWSTREMQADSANYDPNYVFALAASERNDWLANGVTAEQVTEYEGNRTQAYHDQHRRLYGGAADSVKGFVENDFTLGFAYQASPDENAAIREGSSWSDAQLKLSIGAGLLKEITDTVTVIKEPNAKGNNVTLIAGAALGSLDAPRDIDLTDLDALSQEEKAALAAAERGDASLLDDSTIRIVQPRPVNVTVADIGALVAQASDGGALIGSEGDLRIGRVSATGEVRIKTAGALTTGPSNPGVASVRGQRMILEAANGGIGDASAPVRLELLDGASLLARAADDIHIDNESGDLWLDTLYSRQDIFLTSPGAILDRYANEEMNVRSRSMQLTAGGSIGTTDNPLDIGNDADGQVAASSGLADVIYLNVPEGTARFTSVSAGETTGITSSVGYAVDGLVRASGPVSLSAAGGIEIGSGGVARSDRGDIAVLAGVLTMQEGAWIDALLGDVTIDTLAGAALSSVSAGRDVRVAAGDDITGVGDGVNLMGDSFIINSRNGSVGSVAQYLVGDSSGVVNIAANEDVYYRELNGDLVSDRIVAERGAVGIEAVNGSAILGLVSAAGPVQLVVGGDSLTADQVEGQSIAMSVAGEGGTLAVTDVVVADELTVNADNIDLPNVNHSEADELHVSISGNDGGAADSFTMQVTSSGEVVYDVLKANTFDLVLSTDNVEFNDIVVVSLARIDTPLHRVVIDNDDSSRRLYPETTAQLYSLDKVLSLRLVPERLMFTDALLIDYDPDYIVNGFSTENSLPRLQLKRDTLAGLTAEAFVTDGSVSQAILVSDIMADNLAPAAAGLVDYSNDDDEELLGLQDADAAQTSDDLVIAE